MTLTLRLRSHKLSKMSRRGCSVTCYLTLDKSLLTDLVQHESPDTFVLDNSSRRVIH